MSWLPGGGRRRPQRVTSACSDGRRDTLRLPPLLLPPGAAAAAGAAVSPIWRLKVNLIVIYQLGLNLKIRHGAIVNNVVTYMYVYAKFGDDRFWNEKNLADRKSNNNTSTKNNNNVGGHWGPVPGYKNCKKCTTSINMHFDHSTAIVPHTIVACVYRYSPCPPKYIVERADGEAVFEINGPVCPFQCICCPRDIEFPVNLFIFTLSIVTSAGRYCDRSCLLVN